MSWFNANNRNKCYTATLKDIKKDFLVERGGIIVIVYLYGIEGIRFDDIILISS